MAHDKYKKDISNLETSFIDVYRVLTLFNVTDPCIQHAVKKLLCAGGRGVKDKEQDIHEARDSMNRWIEMRLEETEKPEMPAWDINVLNPEIAAHRNFVKAQDILYGANTNEKTLSANEPKQDAAKKENASTYQISGFYGS